MSRWFGSSAESVGKTSRAIVSVARRATGFQLATLAFESRFMFRIIALASRMVDFLGMSSCVQWAKRNPR